ncbi:SusC/RagA family TonB-linked outer membrane protein [Capnocytophaga canimorsus]|uniref:SusC/RagA family TonB-linked outer membrane protein n=1 Tax=Capnocytophaga canimorsus TaxID=28188 RepID=UPI001ACC130C|nr:TonB-dependent receptor [Capnocytophaga canimorsus]GIM59345.1 SusC/RagA family TonB-linked outer membrane protein [Capnocytophaga canimorsus]
MSKQFYMLLVLLFLGVASLSAQVKVKGTITDESGNPLPGANVVVKGAKKGVVSDFDGNYQIEAKQGDVLEFSFVGFQTQVKKVMGGGKQLIINVLLKEDSQQLDDVVVVGYGQQKKESLVMSISTVKPKDISTPTRNLTNALAGQIAGLIAVQRSGEPGYDSAEFWIRGISSFAGGTRPLVLVDGVPRSINDVEPDEIETFSILKDAAATAVYGASGANGVVLVTTKRGGVLKPKISFRTEHSVSIPTRLPKFVNSAEYMELFNEARYNDGETPFFEEDFIQKYRDNIDADLYPNTNWLKVMLSDFTTNQRYSLNVQGGSTKAKYFVSGAYYKESGIFKGDATKKYDSNIGLNRFNLRSNIDMEVSETTSVNIDLSGQYMVNVYPGTGTPSIFRAMLITPPYVFPHQYSDGTIATYPQERDANMRNPYNLLMHSGYAKEWRTAFQSKVGFNQKLDMILEGLKLRAFVSFDFDNNFYSKRTFNPTRYYATGREADGSLKFTKVVSGQPDLQPHSERADANKKIYFETAFDYAKTFANHRVGGLVLYSLREGQNHNNALPYRSMNLVGRVNYDYDSRYFLEANFGYTGSEKFAKGYRFGLFPAVGVAYYLSNEKFYPESIKTYVSKVKLRASLGRTGNDNTGGSRFLYRPEFKTNAGGFTQGIGSNGGTNSIGNGIYEERISSPTLSWEIEDKFNLGVELGFWKGRLHLNADYFESERSRILLKRRTLPQVSGFRDDPWANFGIVKNKGIDASLDFNQAFGDFVLGVRSTFTYAKNKIVEYDELPQKYPWIAVTNSRISDNHLYIADRLYTEDDFYVIQNANGTKSYQLKEHLPSTTLGGLLGPGDIKYVDVNGDGVIDTDDRVRGVGNPAVPEIVYGFGASLKYKSFYVSAFFQGVDNTSVRFGGHEAQGWFPFAWKVDQSNFREFAKNRWREGADNTNVLMPRLHTENRTNANNTVASTWWLRDGSFLRLKNVEVGFNLPKEVLKNLKIDKGRIYLLGYNLGVWDKIQYFDPEAGNGNAGLNYPLPRNFTFGIDFTF